MTDTMRFILADRQTGNEADYATVSRFVEWWKDNLIYVVADDQPPTAMLRDWNPISIRECLDRVFPDDPGRFEVRWERER